MKDRSDDPSYTSLPFIGEKNSIINCFRLINTSIDRYVWFTFLLRNISFCLFNVCWLYQNKNTVYNFSLYKGFFIYLFFYKLIRLLTSAFNDCEVFWLFKQYPFRLSKFAACNIKITKSQLVWFDIPWYQQVALMFVLLFMFVILFHLYFVLFILFFIVCCCLFRVGVFFGRY